MAAIKKGLCQDIAFDSNTSQVPRSVKDCGTAFLTRLRAMLYLITVC